jgi:hypothetical protein
MTGDRSGHAKREVISQGIRGSRAMRGRDTRSLEELGERLAARFCPNAIVDTKQDNRPVVIRFTSASLGKHSHERVRDGLRPHARALHGLKQLGKETKGRKRKTLQVPIRPSVTTRGLGLGRFLDDGLEVLPGEGGHNRKTR